MLSATEPTVTTKAAHSEYTIPMRLISLADDKTISSSMTFREAGKLFAFSAVQSWNIGEYVSDCLAGRRSVCHEERGALSALCK